MGSRAIYHDGWMASAFGPRLPWVPGLPPGIRDWTPDKDTWELYNLDEDWSQANDLAAQMPEKLAQMKELFLIEAAQEQRLPDRRRPVDPDPAPRAADLARRTPSGTSPATSSACPSSAPRRSATEPNLVTIDARDPRRRQRRALRARRRPAAASPATSTTASSATSTTSSSSAHQDPRRRRSFRPARRRSRSRPTYVEPKPAGPLNDHHDGQRRAVVADGHRPDQRPAAVHRQRLPRHRHRLGSPVSLDYYDKAPFKFNGTIHEMRVEYLRPQG